MEAGRPSRTALGAAMHRAVHQTLEGGSIFADPFAVQILDDEARQALPAFASDTTQRAMRLFIAARSRFSEEAMAACVARGTRQVVILGAGLDTFALRNPHAGVTVYEVDYPATQAWKRERLAQAGLTLPPSTTFAPIDFERQSLGKGLSASGFRADEPAFFQWLGVTPYLTREAIISTLDFVAGIAGSEVVFEYGEPFENYPPAMRANLVAVAASAAARGEPWLSLFNPPDMAALLQARQFAAFEDVTRAELAMRYYGDLGEGLRSTPGPHVVRAIA
ncbi:MAG: class I SAM-dependent methyltransferase [Bradyrhizobium sp.]|nr:class I SAM-dependent methyltransferase [Bradyrhizobium sp.]